MGEEKGIDRKQSKRKRKVIKGSGKEEKRKRMTRPKQEMIVQDPPATSSNEAHQGSHAEPEQDPGSHEARFKYLQWQSLYEIEKPFEILIDIPSTASDQRRSNLVFGLSSRKQKIQSVRNRETYFRLDTHGFAFRKHETKFTDWTDRDAVEKTYIPEMELLLKREVKGADRVFTYDWRVHFVLIKPHPTPPFKASLFSFPSRTNEMPFFLFHAFFLLVFWGVLRLSLWCLSSGTVRAFSLLSLT